MIITIDGLPEGQKVSSIKVDVEFTDGSVDIKTNIDAHTVSKTPVMVTDQPPKNSPVQCREVKDIPAEMKDQEF